MKSTLNFSVILDNLPLLLSGLWLTLQVTAASILVGILIAAFGAYQVVNGGRIVRLAWTSYIEVIRNSPLLAQLFFIFFALPTIGLRLDANVAAVVALSLNFAAYAVEIIRAGIESVPRGQTEAGTALSMSRFHIYRYIVLKPALAAIYPALASQCVLVLLGSSVISTVSAEDLGAAATVLQTESFRALEVYLAITVIYLVTALLFQVALKLAGRLMFGFAYAGRR